MVCSAARPPATVHITVHRSNEPPTGTPDAYTTAEDTSLTVDAPGVLVNDNDPESAPMTVSLASDVTQGDLQLADDGSFTYTPPADFSGDVSFTYRVIDEGNLTSDPVSVTITVTPVNDPPVAVNDPDANDPIGDAYALDEDSSISVATPGVLANDSDAENDPLAAILEDSPNHGSVTLAADGSFTYTPASDYHGIDSFTYKANDGSLSSQIAVVSLSIAAVKDVFDDAVTTEEDTPVTGDVTTNDTFSAPSTFVIHEDAANGTVNDLNNGQFEYTPNADFVGTDSFTYTATDVARQH